MKKRCIALVDFSKQSKPIIKQTYEWSVQSGATLLLFIKQ